MATAKGQHANPWNVPNFYYLWLIHVDVWPKPSQYGNYPPIKNKFFLIKKTPHNLSSSPPSHDLEKN